MRNIYEFVKARLEVIRQEKEKLKKGVADKQYELKKLELNVKMMNDSSFSVTAH